MTRDWAEERAGHDAAKLVDSLVQCGWADDDIPQGIVDNMAEYIDAALREAEERAKAECEQHGLEALRLAHEHEQTAVEQARLAERQALEARLREPDDAMVQAVCGFKGADGVNGMYVEGPLGGLLATVADALFPPSKEGE